MRQCLTFQSVEAIKSSFKTYLLQVISHITAASQQKPMNTVLVFRSNLRHFFLFDPIYGHGSGCPSSWLIDVTLADEDTN